MVSPSGTREAVVGLVSVGSKPSVPTVMAKMSAPSEMNTAPGESVSDHVGDSFLEFQKESVLETVATASARA